MKAELSGINIVILGSFNPKIFQPAWFAANELIRKLEAEEADTEIIHNDISIFRIGDWLRLEVTRDRFNASTEQEAYFEVLVLRPRSSERLSGNLESAKMVLY